MDAYSKYQRILVQAISDEDAAGHMGVPVEEARAIQEEMQADVVYPG